jgi:hypothetical protein
MIFLYCCSFQASIISIPFLATPSTGTNQQLSMPPLEIRMAEVIAGTTHRRPLLMILG